MRRPPGVPYLSAKIGRPCAEYPSPTMSWVRSSGPGGGGTVVVVEVLVVVVVEVVVVELVVVLVVVLVVDSLLATAVAELGAAASTASTPVDDSPVHESITIDITPTTTIRRHVHDVPDTTCTWGRTPVMR
jgi:hypothetical protein